MAVTVEGSVERIVFRNAENGYTVARLRIEVGGSAAGGRSAADRARRFHEELVTIVGTLPNIAVGEVLECVGDWEMSEFGRQLRVATFIPSTPVSAKGLARYLGSGIIKGIGPRTAERIVAQFGEQTLAVIELEPDRLMEVKGISPAKRAAIVAGWEAQHEVRKIMLFLQDHQVTPSLAGKIYQHYGQDSLNVIRENPYQLEHDITGVGFKTADAIAVELGLPHDSLPRVMTGIKHTLGEASNDGHCYLPREECVARAATLLTVAVDLVPPALAELARARRQPAAETDEGGGSAASGGSATSTVRREVILEEDRVYLSPFFFSEVGITRRIHQTRRAPSALPPIPSAAWGQLLLDAELAGGSAVPLAPRQRDAVRMAYEEKIAILTGGPGTGKTTTIRALVHLLERHGISYALAAPTGRAARRMTEATQRPASTLHRLLEFIPSSNQFQRNEQRPLPIAFMIVDEVSMIDLVLMYNLLKALPPTAHLLLVGDADQLPSVGPGNVLHDLLASEIVPHVALTELFRQAAASRIIVTAHGVRDGVMPDITPAPESDFFFMAADTPERVAALIQQLVLERLPRRYGFDPVRDIQVLAPMYKGAAGVQMLNEQLQRRLLQRRTAGTAAPEEVPQLAAGARTFHIGDKVMQLRNDYDKGVFNGDMGLVTSIDAHANLVVVEFGEGAFRQTVSYEPHELEALTLAYAISIHRAQGSEYPAVIVPLVMQHAILLQRNLLYTALTRARRLCVLVGEQRALYRAVQNDAVAQRYTTLTQRLRLDTTQANTIS